LSAGLRTDARTFSDRETRGGPLFQVPAALTLTAQVSSDSRKLISGGTSAELRRDERAGLQWSIGPRLRLQPRTRFDAEVVASYQHAESKAFYVASASDAFAAQTFGSRYVFANLLRNTLSTSVRFNVYFTPSLTLQTYAQPFVATGDYRGFQELVSGRDYRFAAYGGASAPIALDLQTNRYRVDPDGAGPAGAFEFGNPDFRVLSLRSNVVLRWEYSPGSTIFVVWNDSGFEGVNDPRFRALRDLSDVFRANMRNVLLVKVNRYLSF
jgi:hypothetical protein